MSELPSLDGRAYLSVLIHLFLSRKAVKLYEKKQGKICITLVCLRVTLFLIE